MAKRFTPAARNIVVAASNAAALLDAEQTEAEHFLIALLVGPPSPAQDYLRGRGLSRADVEQAIADTQQSEVTFDEDDAAALSQLGFDLPRILQELDDRFGPMPQARRPSRGPRRFRAGFGDSAKQLLSQALLEASFRNLEISPELLLLGLLRDPSPTCAELINAYSITYDDALDVMFPPPQSNAG